MNKKIVALIVAVIVIIIVGLGIWITSNKGGSKVDNSSLNTSGNNVEDNTDNEEGNNNGNIDNKRVAVIYFSATGTTGDVAKVISSETGAELIEIVPKKKYTSTDLNWNDTGSRTSVECNDPKSRPEIENTINVDNYDVIFLGYPIWWGDVPHIILTFMDTYKLDGKTVIPFCTSGGTGISESMNTLKNYNKKVKWVDGKRLSVLDGEIKNWVNSLDY